MIVGGGKCYTLCECNESKFLWLAIKIIKFRMKTNIFSRRNTVSVRSETNFRVSQDSHVPITSINSRRLQGNEF